MIIAILAYIVSTIIWSFINLLTGNTKSTTLNCGIFGFAGKPDLTDDQKRNAIGKVKILGLFNVARGQHSCGIFIDNEIFKGIDKLRIFDDFIQNQVFPIPKENMVIIAHTRQATHGGHTADNAHPFLINEHLVGVHNGVIKNAWELCNKNKVSHATIHVDSKALYTLLEMLGTDILKEYQGKAALAWTNIKTPNEMFLFHGASKETTGGSLVEERPMYVMKTRDGIFFSSLDTALDAIKEETDETPEILNYNEVHKIVNGDFSEEIIEIERAEINLKNSYATGFSKESRSPTNSRVGGSSHLGGSTPEKFHGCKSGVNYSYPPPIDDVNYDSIEDAKAAMRVDTSAIKYNPLIFRENIPPKAFEDEKGGIVFYFRGRNWWNKPMTCCHGVMYLSDRGKVGSMISSGSKYEAYYFFRGVLLRNKEAFDTLTAMELDKKDAKSFVNSNCVNFASYISSYSKHPVTNLPHEGTSVAPMHRWVWYLDGRRFDGSATPKFSGARHYVIKSGTLMEIKGFKKDKDIILSSPMDVENKINDYNRKKVITMFDDKSLSVVVDSETEMGQETTDDGFADYCFDIIHASFDNLVDSLGVPEMNTLKKLLEIHNENEGIPEMGNKELNHELNVYFNEAINQGRTIRDVIPDKNNRLDEIYEEELIFWSRGNSTLKKADSGDWEDPDKAPFHCDAREETNKILIISASEKENFSRAQGTINFHEGYEITGEVDQTEIEEPVEENSIDNEEGLAQEYIDEIQDYLNQDSKREKYMKDIEDVATVITDSVDSLENLNQFGDELESLNSTDYAQEAARIYHAAIQNLVNNLADLNAKYGQTQLNLTLSTKLPV